MQKAELRDFRWNCRELIAEINESDADGGSMLTVGRGERRCRAQVQSTSAMDLAACPDLVDVDPVKSSPSSPELTHMRHVRWKSIQNRRRYVAQMALRGLDVAICCQGRGVVKSDTHKS